jgi:hypothetical protein
VLCVKGQIVIRIILRKTNFSYVCPEPVLPKWSILVYKWRREGVFPHLAASTCQAAATVVVVCLRGGSQLSQLGLLFIHLLLVEVDLVARCFQALLQLLLLHVDRRQITHLLEETQPHSCC